MGEDEHLLARYNAKRDFKKTNEPAGTIEGSRGNAFCVHKHDASRLHYDLRLEMDGVLKSWAVTRGPSPEPADKRLAVRTEDHPLSYGDFEGSIPEGEYGGGTVMLWDRGSWSPVKRKSADLTSGKMHFIIHGERMHGEWLLVRMRGKKGDKRENWLLRKVEDEYAGSSDDLVGRHLTSVKTGRTMNEIAARGANVSQQKTIMKKGTLPRFRKPQLATLADRIPEGSNWLYEIKYDGYRCLLAVAGSKARIYTRSGKDWSARFPDVIKAAAALELPSALLDGEIVKLDQNGNPDFSALQKALKTGEQGFSMFAFDLLELEGRDLATLPTVERKRQLAAVLDPDNQTIRYAEHLSGAGEKLLEMMCEAGQEGIICKRSDAPYRHKRSGNWLKVKCTSRQEFVIVGWRESDKPGRAFASILLAQQQDDNLVYKGRVGTGFSSEEMDSLAARFARLSRKTAPVSVPASEARDAHWISPKLVAEVAFAEFTSEGRVRHGSFIALRSDKTAERIEPEPAISLRETSSSEAKINISSRERVIFPNANATKGDLADFYQAIAPVMLPWLAHRPISLVRCPKGREENCFFQRHHSGSFGDSVKAVSITEKDGDCASYLYVEDVEGLLACVQMSTIEFHGWGSRVDSLEKPDRLVFDLDPDEGMQFAAVRRAAKDIRQQLANIGLVSFAMLSGGKGVHVVVPLTPQADWPSVKDFSRRFAKALSMSQPERFTATMSKQKRKDRIFIDWLRNQRGATSVLPYSVRARKNAPVAVPVSWEELQSIEVATHFSIGDVDTLVERAASAGLQRWGAVRQVLPDL